MSAEPRWIEVAKAENIPLREGRAVEVEGKELAIFNLGDRFFAVENQCPHRGGPLADGIVSGNVVVCPLHAWKVCLEDGSVVKPIEERACVASYNTKVEAGVVWVQLPPKDRSEAAQAVQLLASARIGDPGSEPDLEL